MDDLKARAVRANSKNSRWAVADGLGPRGGSVEVTVARDQNPRLRNGAIRWKGI
jgi:hypothetical protein